MEIQTQQTNANNPAAFAAVMNSVGLPPTLSVFRPKVKESTQAKETDSKMPKSVKAAIEVADALVADYTKLKVEVLDRSDRALWEMLEGVYKFVRQIEKSATKRETRNELIKQIQQRDKQGMASNSNTEAVVVRYVFADQSRQSRNNYTIALEKAYANEIAEDAFADFLATHGGVCKVVEKVFDYEEAQQENAKDLAETLKAEKTTRTQLVGRLFSLMARSTDNQIAYQGEVSNWVPEKPKTNVDRKGKGAEKVDPKYETGNFVFFVTVKNGETGKYHVVQGNVFDKAYEQQLLASIAERMDAPTQELDAAVQSLEKSIGFTHMTAEQEVEAA